MTHIKDEYLEKLESVLNKHANIVDSDSYNLWLAKTFLTCDSQIVWSQIPNTIRDRANYCQPNYDYDKKATEFVSKIAKLTQYQEQLIIIPDGATEYSVKMTFDDLIAVVGEIVDFPQHTYIIPEDKSFVIVLTMDGLMDYAPTPAQYP